MAARWHVATFALVLASGVLVGPALAGDGGGGGGDGGGGGPSPTLDNLPPRSPRDRPLIDWRREEEFFREWNDRQSREERQRADRENPEAVWDRNAMNNLSTDN